MKALIKFLAVCTTTMMLFACGGGDSLSRDNDGGTDPDTTPVVTYSVSMAIADSQGNAANEVSEGNPLTITATLTATNGGSVSDVLVTFSFSQDGLATFNNDTATALTNADGVAVIGLEVGDLRGDGVITGTIEAGASGTVGFSSAGKQQAQVIPASLELFATQLSMASSGDEKVNLIAVVKNAQNVLLEGVTVSFSADAGASIENIVGTTGVDGKATATLTTENNPENRTVTVTAVTSSLPDTSIKVKVEGTEIQISGATPEINGETSVIINDQLPIIINLVDSSGAGIAGQQITLTTSVGELDNLSPTTGANGQVTVNFTATTSGKGTITASALNVDDSLEVTVQQDDFSFSSLPTNAIPLKTNQDISVRWFKNNSAFSGGDVTVSTSRGEIATPTVTTNAEGIATVSISSEFAGPASISAIGTDSDGNSVTARANIEFVATQVQSVFVDASPDLIGPEGQTSTISAVVRDPKGNLVKGKVVDFTLIDSSGGSIEPNSATTGSNGIATTVYTSNAVSPQNGVTIQATADGIRSQVDLTVGDRAFDISIGTGNQIISQDSSTYLKEFAVFVSDSVGRPVENASLTASATPIKFVNQGYYKKGTWRWDDIAKIWYINPVITCANEDINNNGRLDAAEDSNGNGILDAGEDTNNNGILDPKEDINGDGELTPGIIGTISFKDGVTRTDTAGQATLELRYPKQFAPWVGVEISVFGQSSGSEAKDSQSLVLPVANSDINDQSNAPPANPFGELADCTTPN